MNIMMKDVILLIVVCDCGYLNIFKYLIKLGVKVDLKDNNKIVFYFLFYWDYLNIIKCLIEMEFNVGIFCNIIKERLFIIVCESG